MGKRIPCALSKIILALLTFQLIGCAGKRPDLTRLYEVSSTGYFQNPVILVHGAFGAKLRHRKTGEVIWPPSFAKMLFGRFESLAVKIDEETHDVLESDVEAFALFDKAGGRDFYGRIIRAFSEAGGYAHGKAGEKNEKRSRKYYVFTYDWRQDIVKNVAALDRLIEQIRIDYNTPGLKVDIVAHSMGALLTRYFIRYGTKDVLDDSTYVPNYRGAAKTRNVILIGAPNLGSISGLQSFMMGAWIGLGYIKPEIFVTMPSAYQLLPHPDRDWMITPNGKKFPRDLYSVETWRKYQWSIFHPAMRKRITKKIGNMAEAKRYLKTLEKYFEKQLLRSKHFHRSLSVPMKATAVRYVVFGGDCELTPARCLVETVDGETKIRLKPAQIVNRIPGVDYNKLMLEPGDGRVTKPSLLARNTLDPSLSKNEDGAFPLAFAVFLCEKHATLTGNISFQDNLLNILLLQGTTEDRLRPATPPPQSMEPQ